MKTVLLLLIHLSIGIFYYYMATAKGKALPRLALIFKIALLALSFLLEFVRQDFIVIGQVALGEHTTVLWLILFEIADALISQKKKK